MGMDMKKDKLLDIFVEERVHGILEEAARDSVEYQAAQREYDKACNELNQAALNERQCDVVNSVLSAANHCGAVYGVIAYRQGFDDGVRLTAEIKEECLEKAGDM